MMVVEILSVFLLHSYLYVLHSELLF
jgi:hypothetical protein